MRLLFFVSLLAGCFYVTPLYPQNLSDSNHSSDYNVTHKGQYRINFYSVDNDYSGQDQQQAARMRIRQEINIRYSSELKSSLRLQLSHTNENVTDATDVNGNGVLIRHAVIDYRPKKSLHLKTGTVPVLEYQNDLLYSKSWGYNPLALEGFSEQGRWLLHYFAASLKEGSENNITDDAFHYQLDLIWHPSDTLSLAFSATLMDIFYQAEEGFHTNGGARLSYKGRGTELRANLLYSHTDGALLGGYEGEGWAAACEMLRKTERVSWGFLATHASGSRFGSGFLVPVSFTGTTTYWGYSGIVTQQFETDTGFTSDSIHMSNNGYGLSSVQLKGEYTVSHGHKIYSALGWFGNSKASGRSRDVAYEAVIIDRHQLSRQLSLNLGLDYATLYDSLSGYTQGVFGGNSSFNNGVGEIRHKIAMFGRVQLAF